MQNRRDKYFELTLLLLTLCLGYMLIRQFTDFAAGILGAVTLYVLLRRINFYLRRKIGARLAPWVLTLSVTLFVLIPLSLAVWYALNRAQNLSLDPKLIINKASALIQLIEAKTGFDLLSAQSIAFVTARITTLANLLMAGINDFAVNFFTAILLLFFMLAGGMKMERGIARFLPFSDHNKKLIIRKIVLIVRSNAIGIPLLALMQGLIATLGYIFCSVSNPLLFGLLTGFCSIIPIVGTMLVWVPLAVMLYIGDNSPYAALGLLLYGVLIISQCDNVLRMLLQKKMADTHPLVTIAGVIAGLPLFGFMGLIFGPLLIALFLLCIEMFSRQYLMVKEPDAQSTPAHPITLAYRQYLAKSCSKIPKARSTSDKGRNSSF